MTKTLTKQWREGTLPEGYYYIRWSFNIDDEPSYMIDFYDRENFVGGAFINKQRKFIDEVMCVVPSYEEYKKLRKLPLKCFQLEEDNSALVVINKEMSQKIERLEFDNEALEMAHNEGKEINAELVSKNEHLEKKLAIATKALKKMEKRQFSMRRASIRRN